MNQSFRALLIIALLGVVCLAALQMILQAGSGLSPARSVTNCPELTRQYMKEAWPIIRGFGDEMPVNASRAALPSIVSSLQEKKRRFAQIEPPGCAAAASQQVSNGMDVVVQAYLDFMARKDDVTVQIEMSTGMEMLADGAEKLVSLAEGTPMP